MNTRTFFYLVMEKQLLAFFVFCLSAFGSAQTIISQDFEGPLTNWYNEGSVVGNENSVSPLSGSSMLSLGNFERLECPQFNLPAGNKNVAFWFRTYAPASPYIYSIRVNLMQGGNQIVTLGTYTMSESEWQYIAVNIPSGYSGSGHSIQFEVPNYASPTFFKFYLDEISISQGLASGLSLLSISEPKDLRFYPNPTNGSIFLQGVKEVGGIKLYDALGKEVKFNLEQLGSDLKLEINSTNGFYYLRTNNTILKVVKE